MKNSLLREKSFNFAVEIVQCVQYLQNEKREFVISKQILRSGTSIGAQLKEAEFSSSTAEFIYKFSISLREANETEYWLRLLYQTGYLPQERFESLKGQCQELIAMLIASIKTLKSKSKQRTDS